MPPLPEIELALAAWREAERALEAARGTSDVVAAQVENERARDRYHELTDREAELDRDWAKSPGDTPPETAGSG